jgi:hypothetical protein
LCDPFLRWLRREGWRGEENQGEIAGSDPQRIGWKRMTYWIRSSAGRKTYDPSSRGPQGNTLSRISKIWGIIVKEALQVTKFLRGVVSGEGVGILCQPGGGFGGFRSVDRNETGGRGSKNQENRDNKALSHVQRGGDLLVLELGCSRVGILKSRKVWSRRLDASVALNLDTIKLTARMM